MFSERVINTLKLLSYLASLESDAYQSSQDLAQKLAIPRPSVRKLVEQFASLGYLDTKPGPGGGTRMRKPPESITVAELLDHCGELRLQRNAKESNRYDLAVQGVTEDWLQFFEREVLGDWTLADLATELPEEDPG